MHEDRIFIRYKKASFPVTFRCEFFDDGRLNVTATAELSGQTIEVTDGSREDALKQLCFLLMVHLDKGSLVYKEPPEVPGGMEAIYPRNPGTNENPETNEPLTKGPKEYECPADRPNMFREVLTLIVTQINEWENDKQDGSHKTLKSIKGLCKAYLAPFNQSRVTNVKSICDNLHVKLTKAGKKVIQGKHLDATSDDYKKDVDKFNALLEHVESVFKDLTDLDESLYSNPHPLMRLAPYMIPCPNKHIREMMDRCVKRCIRQLELIQEGKKYIAEDSKPNKWRSHDAVSTIMKIIEEAMTVSHKAPEALLDDIFHTAAKALIDINYYEPGMADKIEDIVDILDHRKGTQ